MISAMNEMISILLTVAIMLAALATLIRFARHDRFAAPGTGFQPSDEFGPLRDRRRPA